MHLSNIELQERHYKISVRLSRCYFIHFPSLVISRTDYFNHLSSRHSVPFTKPMGRCALAERRENLCITPTHLYFFTILLFFWKGCYPGWSSGGWMLFNPFQEIFSLVSLLWWDVLSIYISGRCCWCCMSCKSGTPELCRAECGFCLWWALTSVPLCS